MLKNLTLSAEDSLIELAKARAQREGKSLNAIFREWLVRYVGGNASAKQYGRLMNQLEHVSSGKTFSRDELNER